jgi:hypothetical protein
MESAPLPESVQVVQTAATVGYFVSAERLQKLEAIAKLAYEVSDQYNHTGTKFYYLKHLCIDLACIDSR